MSTPHITHSVCPNRPLLGLIFAQGHDGAIGVHGELPWYLPEDLALFQHVTTGSDILMGRKTWDSIPARNRPLANRRNIVVTSANADNFPGAHVVRSAQEAYFNATGKIAWCIGGAGLFDMLADQADLLLITDVDLDVPDADTFAPNWHRRDFCATQVSPEHGWHTSRTGLRFRVTLYVRRGITVPDVDLGL
ncbi:dihydrofolate reductase [Arcanobacterium canis]|uniref:dihydrofolate reductase n=1 Tax=Arcanobacterium canis TaxID=999183 RepID=A0ABY8FWQ1_9ACTO|nr:dihydrofolate reductase [Arcanobacterium canis]WFM82945.1 dihydrofolate reductase [Arcanobacterium canis]